jgi:ribulose-phosphate 3-epimerase
MAVRQGTSTDTSWPLWRDRSRVLLAPSLLASDLSDMRHAVARLGDAYDMLHVDVMDGHYVPNLTFGPPVIKALAPHIDRPMDVHLMVSNPDRLLEAYAEAGALTLVVHEETLTHAQRTLEHIRSLGCHAGVALNPGTSPETVRWLLPSLDMILLMSVNPGFSGQSFIPNVMEKIRVTREMIDRSGYPIRLEVDGGIGADNIAEVVRAGADTVVAGSAVFGADDPNAACERLKAEIRLAKARL